jgi:hypothetical protein
LAADEVQNAANDLVGSATTIANGAVDLGREAAQEVLGAVIEAVDILGTALKSLQSQL